jgi:hypothetical protein
MAACESGSVGSDEGSTFLSGEPLHFAKLFLRVGDSDGQSFTGAATALTTACSNIAAESKTPIGVRMPFALRVGC